MFYFQLNGKWQLAKVSQAVRDMKAVFVSYEDFPSSHDEYLSLESISTANGESQISWDAITPETIVRCRWGRNADVYYAKMKQKVCCDFVRVEFPELGSDFDRWVFPKQLRTANV